MVVVGRWEVSGQDPEKFLYWKYLNVSGFVYRWKPTSKGVCQREKQYCSYISDDLKTPWKWCGKEIVVPENIHIPVGLKQLKGKHFCWKHLSDLLLLACHPQTCWVLTLLSSANRHCLIHSEDRKEFLRILCWFPRPFAIALKHFGSW